MKNHIHIFLLLFFMSFGYAQNENSISINFDNIPQKEALISLEEQTGLKFYFQDNWFDDVLVTKNYDNKSITFILEDLLKDTTVNYFIYDDKIILTNNSVIYDIYPDKVIDTVSNNSEESKPLFYNQFVNTDGLTDVLTIGKQSIDNKEKTFKISGSAKNEINNEPIQGLVVSIPKENINVVSDKNGNYTLNIPAGYYSIETRLLGYQPIKQNILVYGNGRLGLSVPESAELLEEVYIDFKKDDNIKEASVGITRIDIENIKTVPLVLGERDIFKVATTLPGIKTAGEGAAGYNVRGGKADQNLILLDEGVVYNPSHFLGFFSAINPFTSGKADIYKASIPAQYGGRLSSVFDIETKSPNMTTFSGEGSIGPITANLSVETPIVKEKSGLITGVRATYSDWVLRSLNDETLNNSEASFFDAIIKYEHKINEKNRLHATGYFSNDKFSISSDSIFKYNNMLGSLKWEHTFNDKNKGELILVNSRYKFGIDYEGESSGNNNNFEFDYTINETQLKLNLKYLHSDKHKFNYGLSSKLYKVNPGNIRPLGNNSDIDEKNINQEKGLESALYFSDLYEVNDKLLVDVGLRYSFFTALGPATQNTYQNGLPRNEGSINGTNTYGNNETIKTYGGPELRASMRYLLTPSLSIKASYNKTIQYIHLLSSNTTVSPTDTWKLSDLNIKPQRANQFAIGLFKNLDEPELELSLEGYYKTMKDLLDYKVGAELILNDNIEQEVLNGNGKAYGVELLIKKKKGKLNGWFGYSYSRSFVKLDSEIIQERVNNGEFFPANYDKPHDLSIVANYKLTQRYSISTNFIYQTGRPITYPIGNFIFAGEEQVLYSDRNQFRIPDYYRLDIGVNIEGNHKLKKLAHSFWNISIYNVLGRNNPYSVFFLNEDGKIQAYKTSIFSIPVPTITYNFKF